MAVFKIKDMACAYRKGKVILFIENFVIPDREICVLFGASGSGKSTILETLGLMTNTLHIEDSISPSIEFFPGDGSPSINYFLGSNPVQSTIWDIKPFKKNSPKDLRKDYFAFIFQDTNLMQSFTAVENVAVTYLVETGSKNEAIQKAKAILNEKLELPIDEFRPVTNLSGGQRQRLAFGRALVSHFTLLFGDEPTGNLDHVMSRSLMEGLNDFVHINNAISYAFSSIIVSHDIELTLETSDRIIVLTPVNNLINKENDPTLRGKMPSVPKTYSVVEKENVFVSKLVDGEKKWFREIDQSNQIKTEEMKTVLKKLLALYYRKKK